MVREGSYRELKRSSRSIYAYVREGAGQCLLVVCSFSNRTTYFSAPDEFDLSSGKLCLCDVEDALEGNGFFLRPYGHRVYLWEDRSAEGPLSA